MPENGRVSAALNRLVETGALVPDRCQAEAALLLDGVCEALAARRGGLIASLTRLRRRPVTGVYLYGPVGRGKTLLMDRFFAAAPVSGKRRVHFHEFMDEVHARIAEYRQSERAGVGAGDPVAAVTRTILAGTELLCLDEVHISDITNAMLVGRLFEKLFAGGLVLVATSNMPPQRLYENGLNRQLFLPFVKLIETRTQLFALAGEEDYRRGKFTDQAVFHFGVGREAEAAMNALWRRLTGGVDGQPECITSLGRTIRVPRAAMGVARFAFRDLCETPLGARDYLRLARAYDVLIVDNVPQFGRTDRDAAKRFTLLVDTLYDRRVKLGASFAAPLDELACDPSIRAGFERTISRLVEMQSADYLAAPRKADAA